MKRDRTAALERFETAVEFPLLLLAIAMVPILILPTPLLVDLPEAVESAIEAADFLIWGVFAFEYAVRLALTTERWRSDSCRHRPGDRFGCSDGV